VLTEEGLPAVNLTVFLNEHDPDAGSGWQARHLERGALLVVDESNMSDTTQLDRVAKVAARDGARVLFTGDWAQLSAVGAGGALKLLAQEVDAYELSDVRRFTAEWERDASLGVRAGTWTRCAPTTRTGGSWRAARTR
jgi:ATP-dependent exoDNAse (exonuclease V) alpha subunit